MFDRIGVVVHPSRELDRALATLHEWAGGHGAEVVQLATPGLERRVAPEGDVSTCALVVALGGDGTALAAMHAAAPEGRPVLGVACGSLGALTATTADRLEAALDRMAADDWTERRLPALAVERDDGTTTMALNDLVLLRAGAGQVMVEVEVGGECFIRFAGDGLIAATPLGSTAYTLAAGGPMLAPGATGLVLTPLSPHGGVCPPLVAAPDTPVELTLDPGNGGARMEVDGRLHELLDRLEPVSFSLRPQREFATLVSLGDHEPLIAGLRRRRIIVDSPRVLARDEREAAAG